MRYGGLNKLTGAGMPSGSSTTSEFVNCLSENIKLNNFATPSAICNEHRRTREGGKVRQEDDHLKIVLNAKSFITYPSKLSALRMPGEPTVFFGFHRHFRLCEAWSTDEQ